jgi:hypothetical protein
MDDKPPLQTPVWAYAAAGLFIALLGWLFFSWRQSATPQAILWTMLDNNLATSSVTCQITDTSNGADRHEYVRLRFGAQNSAQSFATLTDKNTTVTTESITTPTDNYVRYTAVKTNTKNTNGQSLNFKPLLNVWGHQKPAQNMAAFGQASRQACGLPFASLSHEQRGQIIAAAKQSKAFSFDSAKHVTVHGRQAYQYELNIAPVPYVTYLKSVARALGTNDLQEVVPTSYAGLATSHLTVTVDIARKQLVSVGFPGTKHSASVTDYGLNAPLALPQETIPLTSLQSRLGKVQ